jgi:hypothetical protein
MSDQPKVEALGEHRYLVHARQDEEDIRIRLDATPSVIARLATGEADETRIVEAAAAFLIARQRADDLPSQLDLDDVVAAYDGFEDDLRRRLTQPDV